MGNLLVGSQDERDGQAGSLNEAEVSSVDGPLWFLKGPPLPVVFIW